MHAVDDDPYTQDLFFIVLAPMAGEPFEGTPFVMLAQDGSFLGEHPGEDGMVCLDSHGNEICEWDIKTYRGLLVEAVEDGSAHLCRAALHRGCGVTLYCINVAMDQQSQYPEVARVLRAAVRTETWNAVLHNRRGIAKRVLGVFGTATRILIRPFEAIGYGIVVVGLVSVLSGNPVVVVQANMVLKDLVATSMLLANAYASVPKCLFMAVGVL